MSLDLLLAFCRLYGVIDDYTRTESHIVVVRLGARYRVSTRHAADLLLRMLSERPPLAEVAGSLCVVETPLQPV